MSKHRPWQQKKALTEKDVNYLLGINFPDLEVETLSALGEGWDNTTWLINQEWVFRLPKHPEAAQLLVNEMNILACLPKLNVYYPKPEFICLEPKAFTYPFYGHRYLQGISADRANLIFNERLSLASELGTFLKQLHAFPIEQAKALGIGFDQIGRADVKKCFSQFQARLNYLMQHELVKNTTLLMDAFKINLNTKVPENWVLGHGDLYARHLLLDKDKKLSAVIDWGDCELLSPAIDLGIVYQFLPCSAHPLFWEAYGNVEQTICTFARLRAIYSSVTIAWYAHQIQDKCLLAEGLLGLQLISEAIKAEI